MPVRFCLPLLLLATPALAQTGPAPVSPPAADNPFLHDETKADAEARAATMFARMDLNHDGYLTMAEMAAFFAARMPKTKDGKLPATPAIVTEMFDDADSDHDGKISAEESKAAADRGFDEADTNHDGVVTPAERMAAMQDVTGTRKPKPQETGR